MGERCLRFYYVFSFEWKSFNQISNGLYIFNNNEKQKKTLHIHFWMMMIVIYSNMKLNACTDFI